MSKSMNDAMNDAMNETMHEALNDAIAEQMQSEIGDYQTDMFADSITEPFIEEAEDLSQSNPFQVDFGEAVALQVDKTLVDGQARFDAINPFASYIVQAPAGSGKTALLMQRFLALLSRVDQPEKIIAMTFTKKAAAEMRERIMSALKLGLNDTAPSESVFDVNTWQLARKVLQRDSEQAWSLLQNPNRLRVKTIDGINGFLVGQMPLLSRMGAQPKMTDNASALYLEAARLALKDANSNDAVGSLLRLVNGRYNRAEALLVSMLQKRDQWMGNLLQMRDEQAREHLEFALQLLVEQELKTATAHLQASRDALQEIVQLADYAVANGQADLQPLIGCWPLQAKTELLPAWRALSGWLLTGKDELRRTVTVRDGFPAGKGEAKANKEQFLNALAELRDGLHAQTVLESLQVLKALPDPEYTQTQWENLQWLIHLLTLSAAYLKVVFRSAGQADFIEVAQAASQALGSDLEPTELAQQLDYQIEHLLVDEFQDTSSEQSKLIEKLVAGWQAGDGKTLFIVGDPMQSIYRFREAEVGNFLKAWEGKVADVSLTPLNLEVNFRSSQAVVDWVNQSFKAVFPKQNNIQTGAVAFSKATAFSSDDQQAIFPHWQVNQSAEQEAQQILELIQSRLPEIADVPGAKPKSIALLGRTRSSLMGIALLLKKQGIPFRAVELEGLKDRQEIQDCLALSRALLHLADRPAWIALLRSPLVGLSLNDLHALMGHDLYQPVWALMNAKPLEALGLSETGLQQCAVAMPILKTALQRLHSVPFSWLVKEVWLQLDGAQTVENATALENVEVFIQTLTQFDGETLAGDRLDELIERLYASPDASEGSHKIELMTMHKSKGLEFDTVILPGLGRKPRGDDKQLVSWMQFLGPQIHAQADEMHEWLVIAPIDQKGQASSLLAGLLKRFEQIKSSNELARLLYVAATRAKTQLHLFGSITYKESEKEARIAPTKASLLEALWPCVKSEFETLCYAYEASDADSEQSPILPKVSRLPLQRTKFESLMNFEAYKAPVAVEKLQIDSGRVFTEHAQPETFMADMAEATPEQALLNTTVGNLVHMALELAVHEGVELWNTQLIASRANAYKQWLQQQGLNGELLDEGLRRVLQSLNNAVQNPRVCWALDGSHQDSETEYPLTSLEAESQTVVNHIVDRTYIDEHGIRWIVDYKTSVFDGTRQQASEFIAKKVEMYRPQLARYGALFDVLDGGARAQKWVLYFSYLDRWVEVSEA
ncbi:MAG: UvrD-helicase domain-containing protein [Thiotrichales bacterium]|nr:UvrD-helicase domain-containing protein [Thiotrichales bacterium]